MRVCERNLFFLFVLRGRRVAFKDKDINRGRRTGKPLTPTLSQWEREIRICHFLIITWTT